MTCHQRAVRKLALSDTGLHIDYDAVNTSLLSRVKGALTQSIVAMKAHLPCSSPILRLNGDKSHASIDARRNPRCNPSVRMKYKSHLGVKCQDAQTNPKGPCTHHPQLVILPRSRTSLVFRNTFGPYWQPVEAFFAHSSLEKSSPTFKQSQFKNECGSVKVKGPHRFFSPSGISSSSRSKRRCSSTDHAILNVSDLGPRERFGLPTSICTSFFVSLALGGVLNGGNGGGLGAFRVERLSTAALTRGGQGVGVNESGISDACGPFGMSTSTNVGLTNALSTWEVVLQTNRNVGRRRQPDPTGQRCRLIVEFVDSTVGASLA